MTRPHVVVIGGPDVHHRIELIDRLSVDFRFSAIGSDPLLSGRFLADKIAYRTYPMARSFDLAADCRSGNRVRSLLRELRPDIVHCFDTKPAIFGRIAARTAGVPVVVGTLPGLGGLYTYDSRRIRRRRWVFDRLQYLASELSQWTIFQNCDDRALLVERGIVPAGRSSVIDGSGVDPRRFRRSSGAACDALRAELGLVGRRVVLFVGRWIKAKGLLDLADAIPLIRAHIPDAVFVALGDVDRGPDRLTETECARLRREMVCLGTREDVPAVLSIADVVVLATRYREGIPRALIEAAMVGVPIVTTDTPGCREVVDRGRCGWMVPPGSVAGISWAVIRALGDPQEARRRAIVARRNSRKRFDLSIIADEHRLLYDRLLSEASH